MVQAMIEFKDAWLCDMSNPMTGVHACFPNSAGSLNQEGEVRFYAGGRSRVITTDKKTAEFPLVMQNLNRDQVQLLEDWRGRTLLLRDEIGRRVFGTYLNISVDDVYFGSTLGWLSMVSLTFQQLSYSEVV